VSQNEEDEDFRKNLKVLSVRNSPTSKRDSLTNDTNNVEAAEETKYLTISRTVVVVVIVVIAAMVSARPYAFLDNSQESISIR
jgi:hypothetical protein